MKVHGFRVMLVFVMYYIYVTSGSSLLIESTDSMIENDIDGATLAKLPEDFVEFSHLVPRSGLRIKLKAAIEKLMCPDYQPSHQVNFVYDYYVHKIDTLLYQCL